MSVGLETQADIEARADKALTVLIVDDEPFNLELLDNYLTRAGYKTVCASNGADALSILVKNLNRIDMILLDRMMPNMDGIELLHKIKGQHALKHIPVIMQTAAAGKDQMMEGIEAGAYYYLTKPFDEETLMSIVHAAEKDLQQCMIAEEDLQKSITMLHTIKDAHFEFRTVDEADHLANFLAQLFPDAQDALFGLKELMHNAVVSGNLGIDYDEKTVFIDDNTLDDEVERRLALPEYMDRIVKMRYQRTADEIHVHIIDDGEGFDWKKYMKMDANRVMNNHGRGIAIARITSFDSMEYLGKGNEVHCIVKLK